MAFQYMSGSREARRHIRGVPSRHLHRSPYATIMLHMTFYSLPFTPERPQATEARLEKIYEAAKYGLKGDSLALAAGLTPMQYRRLAEFDPLVEMAEMKGRAEGEYVAAKTLHEAAKDGDSKAALDILKHQHGWVAKQQIDVSVDQQISVIGALERAQTRVIEGLYNEIPSLENDNADEFNTGRTRSSELSPAQLSDRHLSEKR